MGEELFVLAHRETGPLATFPTAVDAGREMVRILLDEPYALDDLRLERVEADVDEAVPGTE